MPNKIDFLRDPNNIDYVAFLGAGVYYIIAVVIVIAVNGAPFSWADIGIALILIGLGGVMHRAALVRQAERQVEDLEQKRR